MTQDKTKKHEIDRIAEKFRIEKLIDSLWGCSKDTHCEWFTQYSEDLKTAISDYGKAQLKRGFEAARELHPTDKGIGLTGHRLHHTTFEDFKKSTEGNG